MEAQKTPRKRKKKTKIIFRLAIIAGLVYVAFLISSGVSSPVKTEIVRYGTIEDSTSVNGYLVRNEYIINAPTDGMLSCIAKEGERITKDNKIATVFNGKVDESIQSKINRINERIAEAMRSSIHKDLFAGDVAQIDSTISKQVDDIVYATYIRRTDKVSSHKDDITKLLERKLLAQGQKPTITNTVDLLRQEKAQLEASVSAKKVDIIAPLPGVFSSNLDGFEGFFDIKNREKITPDILVSADKQKFDKIKLIKQGQPAIKIIDNYQWYFAAIVDQKWVQDLKPETLIWLRFSDITDRKLEAMVDSITQPNSEGKVTIIASCDQYVDEIYSLRKANVDIIRRAYNGFKVPKAAVRVLDNGTSGVFVANDSIAKFKQIEILHNNDEFVIVKEDNQKKNALLLYDEVIVNGTNVEDGKVIK